MNHYSEKIQTKNAHHKRTNRNNERNTVLTAPFFTNKLVVEPCAALLRVSCRAPCGLHNAATAFFQTRTYKNPCWMDFSHIRSMYDRVSLYFPYAKEEMEAAKKNKNPKT